MLSCAPVSEIIAYNNSDYNVRASAAGRMSTFDQLFSESPILPNCIILLYYYIIIVK